MLESALAFGPIFCLTESSAIIIMISLRSSSMPVIRPISDLRNNFTLISETIHSSDEPIFLTKNGVGDMVVMSLEHYERQIARLELYQKLQEAESEIAAGATGKDARAVLNTLAST
jgi:prevent-host-death family protein